MFSGCKTVPIGPEIVRRSLYPGLAAALFLLLLISLFTTEASSARVYTGSFRIAGAKEQEVIPAGGINLNLKNEASAFDIVLGENASLKMSLTMYGADTDWALAGSEAAVLSIYLDAAYNQDLVLWAGRKTHTYKISLGELSAGKHKVVLKFAKSKSARGARSIELLSASVSMLQCKCPFERAVYKYAPVLLGRDMLANNHDDTPLALYFEHKTNPDSTTDISYGFVFSNEDGGDATHPARQQARWGRLSDIQHVYTCKLDANNKRIEEWIETKGHLIKPFKGQYYGSHPLIRTCTSNNNVCDSGRSALRFAMLPDYELGANEAMGELMRANPLWFEITAKELQRENKILSDKEFDAIPESRWKELLTAKKMPDPRRYIYVQYNAENTCKSPIAIQVFLKNDSVYSSDFDSENTALEKDGYCQTAVLLPLNTKEADIKEISYIARNGADFEHQKQAAQKAGVREFAHVFKLDQSYKPIELSVPLRTTKTTKTTETKETTETKKGPQAGSSKGEKRD